MLDLLHERVDARLPRSWFQRRDAERKRRLRRMGWDIVDLWWSDLERSDSVIEDVATAIRRAQTLRRTPQ